MLYFVSGSVMSQRFHATSPVVDVLLSIPEREFKTFERSVCHRGVQGMVDLKGLSAHMNDVANQFRDAARTREHETEKQHLSTEAKRWAEMARKADLLAQGGSASAKSSRD